MIDYLTKLTIEEFKTLYPEVPLGDDISEPIVVAIHTNYPTSTYFSRELGTNLYVVVPNATHAYSPRNYWVVERTKTDLPTVKIPKEETARIYIIQGE